MHKEVEIEIKTLVSEETFQFIRMHFIQISEPLKQTNTYFDTPTAILKQHNTALRLRSLGDNTILTLKSKQHQHTALEYSVPFIETLTNTLHTHPEFRSHIPINTITELAPITQFTTFRYTSHLDFGLLCLDKTYYSNGYFDFEIEIEVSTHEDLARAFHWLNTNNVSYFQAKPKIARALDQQSL